MCCKKQTSSYHFENWSEDKSTIYFIFSILRNTQWAKQDIFAVIRKSWFFDDLLIQYGDFENCDFCSFSVVGDFMAIYSHLAILVVSIYFAIFWRFLKIAILGSVIFFGDLAYFSFLKVVQRLYGDLGNIDFWRFRFLLPVFSIFRRFFISPISGNLLAHLSDFWQFYVDFENINFCRFSDFFDGFAILWRF